MIVRRALPATPARRGGGGLKARMALVSLAVIGLMAWVQARPSVKAAAPASGDRPLVISHPQTGGAGPTSPKTGAAIQQQAQEILDNAGGTTAMVAVEPGKSPLVSINASAPLPSASLYKIGVMAAVYDAIARGGLSPGQQITVSQQDVDFYGDAPATAPGTVLTVAEALRRMITVSDNSAAGALIDVVGFDAVNAAFSANGMPSSHLGSGPGTEPRTIAQTTAADQVAFYQRLLAGQVVSPSASNEMISLLEGQQENDRLPAKLPPGTIVAHKTGELDGVRNDSGIIFTPNGPIVCAVLVSDQPDGQQASDAIASEGLLVFQSA